MLEAKEIWGICNPKTYIIVPRAVIRHKYRSSGIIMIEGVINNLQGRYGRLKTCFPLVPPSFDSGVQWSNALTR